MGTQLAPPRKGAQHPQFLAHVYRRQTAGWIMMPLSMEVVHGRRDIVLDGKPAPPTKMCTAPNFRPMSVVAKRLECIKMPLCKAVGLDPGDSVRWALRPSSPQGKGHSSPPLFCPCLLLPNCRPSQQLLSCYGHSA